jgi:hypothetical protein
MPLGMVCSKCGKACELEDSFCGYCGAALSINVGSDFPDGTSAGSASSAPGSIKQYTPREIEDLLAMRKTSKREVQGRRVLRQDDVDELFN